MKTRQLCFGNFLLWYQGCIRYLRSWCWRRRPPSSCRVSTVGFHWRRRSWRCSSPSTPPCWEELDVSAGFVFSDCAAHVHDILVVNPVVQAVEVDPVGTERAKKTSLRSHAQAMKKKSVILVWTNNNTRQCKRLAVRGQRARAWVVGLLTEQPVSERAPSPGQTQHDNAVVPLSQGLVFFDTWLVWLNINSNGEFFFFTNDSARRRNLCILPLSWRSPGCSWKSGRAGRRWAAGLLSCDPARRRWHCWPRTSPSPRPCRVTPVPRGFAVTTERQKEKIYTNTNGICTRRFLLKF